MSLSAITDFLGRFHPVFVHLPIGILLLGCFFHLLSSTRKFSALIPAVPVILFWGMLTAVASCITGYFLSLSGDYEAGLVNTHQWMGIAVAVISLIFYLLTKKSVRPVIAKAFSLSLIILVAVTGHLGGSLTHGSDYISLANTDRGNKGPAIPPIPNIAEAPVYASAVQPLLEARCYSCHGPNKMKGKLRLDKPELIMKGGEDGKAVVMGKTDESLMIERIMLSLDDDDHMPPKEKPQLTRDEIELLHWWIAGGADFNKKFRELPQTDKIKPVLAALQTGKSAGEDASGDIPVEEVARADDGALKKLKDQGIIVLQVAQNSNYLSANFVTAFSTSDSTLKLLQPISKQLIWLNLSNTAITDKDLKIIAGLKNLTKLNLSHTKISDKGLAELSVLANLSYLNLVGVPVSAQGLLQLNKIKKLKNIYLYHTQVKPSDWPSLKQAFEGATLDSGGYHVPTLESDTTLIKY